LVYGTHLVHMPRVLDCHGFKTAGAGRAGGFFYWREGSPEVLTAVFVRAGFVGWHGQVGLLKQPIPNAVGGNEEVQLLRVSTGSNSWSFVTPPPWRYGGTPLCRRVDHHEIEPFRIALAVQGGSPLEQLLDHVRLCLLSTKATRTAPRIWGSGFACDVSKQ
jgi:hypothetical protein